MHQANEWLLRLNQSPYHDIVFEAYDRISSTQDRAHELLNANVARGALIVANAQDHGRGRNGRTWISNENSGLYMSMTWRMKNMTAILTALPLIVACACVEAMQAISGSSLQVHVKWPNDLYVRQRKIGGILIDTRMNAAEQEHAIVIGLGITLNATTEMFPKDLRSRVTAWSMEASNVPSAARVGSSCYTSIRMALERVERLLSGEVNNQRDVHGHAVEWSKAIREWMESYIRWNELMLPYRLGDQIILGTAQQMNELYQLQIRSEQGELIWLRH